MSDVMKTSPSSVDFLRDQNEIFEAQRNSSVNFYCPMRNLSDPTIVSSVDVTQPLEGVSQTASTMNTSSVNKSHPHKVDELMKRIMNLEVSNASLKERMNETEGYLDQVDDYIYTLERSVARLDQYGRRENIEISGIPNKVSKQDLEGEVVKILRHIGLDHIVHYSIVGCHRISGRDRFGNMNTIVRFLHRKDAIECLKRKKNLFQCRDLGYKNLWFSENLCPSFKSIFDNLESLKKKGTVSKYWSRYGKLHYKLNGSEEIFNVSHLLDIDHLFGD